MDSGEDRSGGRIANNIVLMLLARLAMILASVVGLPMAGWMLNRAVEAVDRLGSKVDAIREQGLETNGTVKLIQLGQDNQNRIVADHEARVRALERASRLGAVRNELR
jgi:hypothetical protein